MFVLRVRVLHAQRRKRMCPFEYDRHAHTHTLTANERWHEIRQLKRRTCNVDEKWRKKRRN